MIPEATGARGYTEDPPSKRPKPTGEEKGECLLICIFCGGRLHPQAGMPVFPQETDGRGRQGGDQG